MKAQMDDRQAEHDAHLEAMVFANNFEMWKALFDKPELHEDDIPDEDLEWANSPEDFRQMMDVLKESGVVS